MNGTLKEIVKYSSLLRRIARKIVTYIPGISRSVTLHQRLVLGAMPRLYCLYCAARAANLALRLGYKEVSILEFGVAGGNGLVALEAIKEIIERYLPIKIRLFGFDIGSGLPMAVDRDLPYQWQSGFYEMDVKLLRSRLKTAELVLGPISETIPTYIVRLAPTLFGDWALLREWGRSGSPGTVRVTSFEQCAEAEKAEQRIIKRRLSHGYSERAFSAS